MFLELKNIRKSFGEGSSLIEVLKGIDLSVEKGQFVVLLGPSGSGKSTLLNIIGGIDSADAKEINEERYAKEREKEIADAKAVLERAEAECANA